MIDLRADVLTPTQSIKKALVEYDPELPHLRVKDRRKGTVILEVNPATSFSISSNGSTLTFGTENGDIVVTRRRGCGCGGTQIVNL